MVRRENWAQSFVRARAWLRALEVFGDLDRLGRDTPSDNLSDKALLTTGSTLELSVLTSEPRCS
ncbi:MAG: hypothetical protein NVSMB64_05490 [Candidatus Velthaea sp.]